MVWDLPSQGALGLVFRLDKGGLQGTPRARPADIIAVHFPPPESFLTFAGCLQRGLILCLSLRLVRLFLQVCRTKGGTSSAGSPLPPYGILQPRQVESRPGLLRRKKAGATANARRRVARYTASFPARPRPALVHGHPPSCLHTGFQSQNAVDPSKVLQKLKSPAI